MAKKDITKDEKKEIKDEIINELREQIQNEIDNEIKKSIVDKTEKYKQDIQKELNDEVLKTVRKEEKKIIRRKNGAIFRKNILILILLGIIGYLLYCLYTVNYFDFLKKYCKEEVVVEEKKQEIVNPETDKEEEIVKDDAWYLENYSYLLNNATTLLNSDEITSYYLYATDHETSEIKNNYLLNIAAKSMDTKYIKKYGNRLYINNDALKEQFEYIFDLEYTPENFDYKCYSFTYNEKKSIYEATNTNCKNNTREIIEGINKIYEKDENIIIETTASIYDNNEKAFYKFDDLFEPVLTDIEKEDLKDNKDKLNNYKYSFNKIDEKYVLANIEKIK